MENLQNEQALLKEVAAGSRGAFKELYKHYYPVVQQYVSLFAPFRGKLDELTQDVFVRIWEKRQKLGQVDSFRNYLFRVTRNQILNYIRSLKVQQKLKEVQQPSEEPLTEDTDHKLLFSQYYQIAMEAIERLPAGRKQVLKMSIDEGLSLDEIAEKLKISKSGVKHQLYAGTAFVREYLLQHAGISVLLFVFLSLFET